MSADKPGRDDRLLRNWKSLCFFDTNLAVFHFHFQMCAALQLARAHDIDREAVEPFATQEISQSFQSDELSVSAQHMPAQCCHAYRV
jgi:hypothetical protein